MSKIVSGIHVGLNASFLPFVVAAFVGFMLLSVRFDSIYYLLILSVCALSSLLAGKWMHNRSVRSFLRRALFVVACLLLLGLMMLPTRAAIITEYSMFGDPRPRGIIVDSGGTPWFTEQLGGRIARLSGNQITELRVPTAGSEPWDIVYLPQPSTGTDDPNADSIWFSESAEGRIGRYKGGVFVEFDLTRGVQEVGYPSEYPTGMAFDTNASRGVPYRNVWFVETGGDAVGRIYYNATGDWKDRWVLTEYSVPGNLEKPIDIAQSPVNGLLFILSLESLNIGSFNPWNGQFKVYDFKGQIGASAGSDVIQAIAVGSDGVVWATLDYSDTSKYDRIVRLDPWSGEIRTYEIPTQGSGPRGITVDKDKNVWFTEYDKDKVGRLNPITGYITEYALPRIGSRPLDITTKDNIVWFSEWQGNRIGRLDTGSAWTYSTVNTITSATSASATATMSTGQPGLTQGYAIFSTSTGHTVNPNLPVQSATVTFLTTGTTYGAGGDTTTMTVYNRFATSTVTSNTETIYVLPTSTTASTTLAFTSTFLTSTTVSPTLTSVIQTDISSTTITISETFSSAVATETSYTTREAVYTDLADTTTVTEFAATSYRFTTVTLPTYTQYSTSTIRATTTQTFSTVTTTETVYSTSTVVTTLTAGVVAPAALAFFVILTKMRRGGFHKVARSEEQ